MPVIEQRVQRLGAMGYTPVIPASRRVRHEDGLFSNVNISKNLGGSLPLQSLGKQATEEVLGGNSRAAILRVRCGRKRQLILATGHLPFVYGSFPL